MSKIYVANVVEYATPSEEAKGDATVGLAVASRLNGDGKLRGSYNPNSSKERKIGFMTFPERFHDEVDGKTGLEQAREYANKMRKGEYKIGSTLNAKDWAWGEIDEDATLAMTGNDNGSAAIHMVEFIGHDEVVVEAKVEVK